jgi:hypothetical protein
VEGVEMHEGNGERLSNRTEAKISHFIPSVELRGSRDEQLQKLDILIVHLQQLRMSLAGNTTIGPGSYGRPSQYVERPVWPWFGAGVVVAVLLVLLLLAAESPR